MTDERTLDRLIAHLRTHVAELRRLEQARAHDRAGPPFSLRGSPHHR